MPPRGGPRSLHWNGEAWALRVTATLTDMEAVAILATHAARFGDPSLELPAAEVPDRVRAFVLTYGRDGAQDTLELPEWAVGWARRHLTAYRNWMEGEAARVLTGRPSRASRVRQLPDE